jgi:transcriptional regulator with XRE-family HTH domain
VAGDGNDHPETDRPHLVETRNDLLRQARLQTPSPNDPIRPMSQRELAEAINDHVFRTTNRKVPLDRHYISRWENGKRRLPIADYRRALRAVLGVATDAELGFSVTPPPWTAAETDQTPPGTVFLTPMAVVTARGVIAYPTDAHHSATPLTAHRGPGVILVSATPQLLSAVIPILTALNEKLQQQPPERGQAAHEDRNDPVRGPE